MATVFEKAASLQGQDNATARRFVNRLLERRDPIEIETLLIAAGYSQRNAMELIEECQTEGLE